MTTDLQRRSADNVFVDNEVMCLIQDEQLAGLPLAGVAWLIHDEAPSIAHRISIAQVAPLILKRLRGYVVWLLACNSTVLPASRLVRHRKLIGALKAQGLTLPLGRKLPERAVEGPAGVRYFAAFQLSADTYDAAVAILHAEPASHLLALKESDEPVVEQLTSAGWDRPPFGPSAAVLSAVCRAKGVVLWPVGAFDDREAGVVALARKEIIAKLL